MKKNGMYFLILSFVLIGVRPTWANSASEAHVVTIKDIKFDPEVLEVHVGDSVVWTNEDLVPHTVTDKGVFDSNTIPADGKYKYTFKKKGQFAYSCNFHPMMKAKITVK